MNFVSLRFCAFFVAAVFVYYVLPRRARQPWLLACSCFFYMCWNPAYIVLILFSAFSTYLCGRALAVLGAPAAGNRGRRRAAMAVSLAANLGILFFFKYYNFFAQSANGLLAARGFPAVPLLGVLLPVGISFYTFQAIGYTVDVYRGSVSAEQRFWRYLLFISFFPQLVAGPIERSGNILPQLQLPARFSYERAKSGLVLMLWGYIQKMVVADRLALLADTVYAQGGALGGWATAAATVLFCFELYCDFYFYTDIARGAARILGVELMENFRSPFLSQSVAEFWRNWHISLSSFFRDYLYIPLGGSRRGLARTCVNTMVVFLCSGLWHGAAWTFVAWGLLHGLYLVCGRLTLPLRKRLYTALRVPHGCLPARLWRTAWTFALVAFSMIFFRAGGMDAALSMVRSLLRPARSGPGSGARLGNGRARPVAFGCVRGGCCFVRRAAAALGQPFGAAAAKAAGCAMGRAAGRGAHGGDIRYVRRGLCGKAVHLFPVLSGEGVNIGERTGSKEDARPAAACPRAGVRVHPAGAALVCAGGAGPQGRVHRRLLC